MTNSKFEKGAEGEKYIASKLSEMGYKVLYVGGCQLYNITGERFYSVDLEPFGNGFTFWVQAKHKEPRTKYPDTGMELWRYKNLIEHQQESGLPVLVLFTDNSKRIYGEWLNNLPKSISPYGGTYNKVDNCEMIYWLMNRLRNYQELLG